MKVAIVGPSLTGKSTFFTAVTGVAADPHKYHGHTPQPGQVDVPDARLDNLAAHYEPKKTTPAKLELLDFSGIEIGARTENVKQLFAAMRDADALLVTLNAFSDDPAGLAKMWDAMKSEFLFADLEVIQKRIEKLQASTKRPSKTQEQDKKELAVLETINAHLEANESWDGLTLDEQQQKIIRGFRFLMQKPAIPVLNTDDLGKIDPAKVLPADAAARALVVNADVERAVREMPADEGAEFMAEFGITEMAAPRVIRAAYDALGLISFFTVGEDECRAWTIERGDDVVTAAGKIHTDLARGFIRAEVFAYDDFAEFGSEKEIKAKGKLRSEGREYIVKDGDVMTVKFAV